MQLLLLVLESHQNPISILKYTIIYRTRITACLLASPTEIAESENCNNTSALADHSVGPTGWVGLMLVVDPVQVVPQMKGDTVLLLVAAIRQEPELHTPRHILVVVLRIHHHTLVVGGTPRSLLEEDIPHSLGEDGHSLHHTRPRTQQEDYHSHLQEVRS